MSYPTKLGLLSCKKRNALNCSHLGCKYNGKRRTNSQRNTLGLRATFVMKQMSHEDIHQATRKQKQTPGPRECYGSGSPWHAEWWPQKHRSRPVGWDCELLGRGPCTRNRSTHGEGSSRPAGRALSPATRVLRRAGQRQTRDRDSGGHSGKATRRRRREPCGHEPRNAGRGRKGPPRSPGRGPCDTSAWALWSPTGEQGARPLSRDELLWQPQDTDGVPSAYPRTTATLTQGRDSMLLYEADFPQMCSETCPPAQGPPPATGVPSTPAPARLPLERLPPPGSVPISDGALQSRCPRGSGSAGRHPVLWALPLHSLGLRPHCRSAGNVMLWSGGPHGREAVRPVLASSSLSSHRRGSSKPEALQSHPNLHGHSRTGR